jgi:HEAT repeat protein
MDEIISKLKEGDLRTIGNVPDLVDMISNDPDLFDVVVRGMNHSDPGVRMRASDAVEKITRTNPDFLRPYKTFLLGDVIQQTQKEVRWHLAQIIPRLELSGPERSKAALELFEFLEDESKIVQTNALQALVDLARDDDQLLIKVRKAIEKLSVAGSPAVRNRAGKLLASIQDH